MSSGKREKILATLFAGTLLGWGSLTILESSYSSGEGHQETPQAVIQRETQELQHEATLVTRSLDRLRSLQAESLPGDPGKAASMYQAWLMTCLSHCGLEEATVTPAPALAEENLGHRVLASIEASGTETAVARFIDSFSATPLLHRITSIDVLPMTSEDAQTMRVSMSVEALSLAGVEREQLPDPRTVLAEAESRSDDATNQNRKSLESLFVARTIFARSKASSANVAQQHPPTPTEQPAASAPLDTTTEAQKPELRFIAAIQRGADREAWFFETVSGESQRCRNSSRLLFGSHEISVVRVAGEETVLRNGSREITIRLGDVIPEQFLTNPEQTEPSGT